MHMTIISGADIAEAQGDFREEPSPRHLNTVALAPRSSTDALARTEAHTGIGEVGLANARATGHTAYDAFRTSSTGATDCRWSLLADGSGALGKVTMVQGEYSGLWPHKHEI